MSAAALDFSRRRNASADPLFRRVLAVGAASGAVLLVVIVGYLIAYSSPLWAIQSPISFLTTPAWVTGIQQADGSTLIDTSAPAASSHSSRTGRRSGEAARWVREGVFIGHSLAEGVAGRRHPECRRARALVLRADDFGEELTDHAGPHRSGGTTLTSGISTDCSQATTHRQGHDTAARTGAVAEHVCYWARGRCWVSSWRGLRSLPLACTS